MSSEYNPRLTALCLGLIASLSLLLTGTSAKADADDHSYLPPWMRNEAAPAADRNEKADPAKAFPNEAQRPVAEAQLVKITEPPSSNLAARVTHAQAKVARFVSNLFNKSVSFVKGQ